MTTRKELIWASLLTVGMLMSAVGVIYAKHASRSLFKQQELLRQGIDRQRTTWRQLQLELGTMAAHSRIERVARVVLKMRMLDPKEVLVVKLENGR